MLRHPLFLIYGLIVVGVAAIAEYQGWTLTPTNRETGVPRSVRDNPGAYRPSYGYYPRYAGGK